MIFDEKKTFIIAEAGVNHNGSLARAFKLIDQAKTCGADAIKFQHFEASKLVTKKAKKAPYQIKNTKNNNTQYKMLKKLELKEKDYFLLKKYCKKKKIKFISSAFDEDSVKFLNEKLREKIIKIPSGEITNFFLLSKLDLKKNLILLSTGMSNYQEISDAINLICKKKIYKFRNNKIYISDKKSHKSIISKIIILHCVTDYPVKYEYANLECIKEMSKDFKLITGYSDHTLGVLAPLASVIFGARVIEKHFTLDKKLSGPDHLASLNPKEFKKMVFEIRQLEKMRGNGKKILQICEKKKHSYCTKEFIGKKNDQKR